MRLLHIIPYPLLPLIGPCFRCLRQLRAASDDGFKTALLCPKVADKKILGELDEPLFKGIDVYAVLPNSSSSLLREIGFLLFSWKILMEYIDKIKPDIIHVHNPPDTLAFVVSIICSCRKIPFVYDIHDSSKEVINAARINYVLKQIYIKLGLFFEAQVLKRAKGILTVSESLKSLLIKTRGVFKKQDPLFVVMRNIDEATESLLKRETVEKDDYIFYSGTIDERFIGLEFLIDSIEETLKGSDTKLYIAGDGRYRAEIEKYVFDKGLSGCIKFFGRIKKEINFEMIQKSKITVIPYERNSLTEIALPNKLFEYMALGKPVVYPDFSGFREVLGMNNEGKYIPDDKNDLHKVVERLLSDKELREMTGENNRRLLKDITFKKESLKLIDLYKEVLSEDSAL